MTFLQFEIHGTPQPQGSKTLTRFGGLREDNKHLAPWRADAIAAIRAEMGDLLPVTAAVTVEAEFYFTRPRSHYGTGRNAMSVKPAAPLLHSQKPDLDKLLRALGDALTQGGAIRDDSQVVQIDASKHWTAAAPTTWVTLTLAD